MKKKIDDRGIGYKAFLKILSLNDDEVKHCIADGAYTDVTFKNRGEIKVSMYLGKIKTNFNNDFHWSCHNSALVNIKNIKEVDTLNNFGIMDDNTLFYISRDEKKNFLYGDFEQKFKLKFRIEKKSDSKEDKHTYILHFRRRLWEYKKKEK